MNTYYLRLLVTSGNAILEVLAKCQLAVLNEDFQFQKNYSSYKINKRIGRFLLLLLLVFGFQLQQGSSQCNVSAGADQTICEGDFATLTASASGGSGPYSFQWSDNLGSGSTKVVSPATTTTYIVTVTDAIGCTNRDVVYVIVDYPLDDPGSISADEAFCDPYDPQLINSDAGATHPGVLRYAPEEECCQGGKIQNLYMKYTGESCDDTYTTMDAGFWGCVDYGAGPNYDNSVYIVASKQNGSDVVFSGTVSLNEIFVMTKPGGSNFPGQLYIYIYSSQGGTLLQEVNFHTSCSVPIIMGEQLGGNQLMGIERTNSVGTCGETPCDIVYQWQKRTGFSGTWTDISGATSATYNPPFINETMQYRRLANCNTSACDFQASNIITKEIYPDPNVSASSNSPVCVDENIELNATFTINGKSTSAVSWSWEGPNGFTSSMENPTAFSATLSKAGTYTVTVTDNNGCTNTATASVIVNPLPIVNASNNSPVCDGDDIILTATFTANGTSTNAVSWSWTGPDGFSSSSEDPPAFASTLDKEGTYTVEVTDNNGCKKIAITNVVVYPLPEVTLDPAGPFCIDDDPHQLVGTPSGAGGIYSGTGVNKDGLFDPTIAGTGNHEITYTYTDGNGCTNSAQLTIVVNPLPEVTLNAAGPFCIDDDPYQLVGNPSGAGGIYSGAGVNKDGLFNPSTAGIGDHVITYTYTDSNGCVNSAQTTITVNPLPVVTLEGAGPFCIDDDAHQLVGSPSGAGGIYSGTGVNKDGLFNPSTAGAGGHVITYTYTDSNGCVNSAQTTITVNPLPEVILDPAGPFCEDDAPYQLVGSPSGGIYTGTGVDKDGLFDPSVAKAGNHDITYTYTDGNGCTNSDQITIIVNPIPEISASSNSPVCEGDNIELTVTFTPSGTSTSAVSWIWTGPDGFTSTMQNPTPFASTLASAGTYVVSVEDNNGCFNITTVDVVVNPLPDVSADSNDPVCDGDDIVLTATFTAGGSSTSAVSWSWSGPDGYSSNMKDPTPFASTLAKAGTYTVEVTDNNGCVNTATVELVVNPLPQVSADSNSPLCDGDDIALTATFTANGTSTSAVSWSWSGPDGYSSNMEDPTPFASTLAKAGNYTVEVTDNNGCVNTATVELVVNPLPQVSADSNSPVCDGDDIALTATFTANGTSTSAVSWSWSGPDGYSSNMEDPTPFASTLARAGTYTVEVTDNNGCVNTATVEVVVNPLPQVSADSNSPVCDGDDIALTATFTANGTSTSAVSWSWSGPDGYSSNMEDPTPFASTLAKAGAYTVEVTDNNGCVNTATVEVVVNPLPQVSADSNSPVCDGDDIALTATFTANGTSTSAVSWSWSGPDGYSSNMEDPTPFASTLAKAGTYTVEVTDNNGCVNTATVEVVVNPLPQVSADSNSPVCDGDDIALTATFTANGTSTSAVSWSWSGPDGYSSNMEDPTPFASTLAKAGNYTVEVTDNNGCVNTATVEVVVNPLPQVSADSNSPVCDGDDIALTATFTANGTSTSAVSWSWSGPDGYSSNMEDPTPFASTLAKAGTYTVEVTDNNGCVNTATVEVVVNPLPQVSADSNSPVCDGDDIALTATFTANGTSTSAVSWSWSGPDGYSSNMEDPTPFASTLAKAGTYTVEVTDNNGCVNTATVEVVVNPLPQVSADSNSPVCDGDDIALTATFTANGTSTSAVSWSWSGPDGYSSNMEDPTPFASTLARAGTYTVEVTDNNGCVNTTTVEVIVEPRAKVGDFVWLDFNNNGVQDIDEQGINGVTVTLYNPGNNIIDQTVTSTFNGEDGYYQFDVCAGKYYIIFGDVNNTIRSPKDATTDDLDSDADPVSGKTDDFVLSPGDNNPDIDAGYSTVADLELTKTVNDETPNVGDVVTFTIEVTNAGPNVATNVAFEDIVPNGYSNITAISDGGTLSGEVITWSGFTINVNGSVEVTFQATVEASGEGVSYVNVSEVTASDQYDPDSTPDNDDGDQSEDDEDNAEIVPQQADLSLEKTVNDETPNVGDVVTFTIEVTNAGPNVATNVAFEDIVPNGYSDITAISDGGTLSGEVITWSGFTINVNGSVEVTFQATVEAPGEGVIYVNESEVTTSDQYDPDSTPDNDDGDQSEDDEDNAEVVPEQADLSLEKTVSDATPNVGDVVTFTIEVSNAGPDVATNVAFEDIVPNGYSDITAISDGGTLSGEVITWSGFTINVNGSVEVTFQATVEAPGEGVSYVNVSEVTASDQYDPDSTPDNDDGDQSEDDEDNAEVVPQQADLSLEKTVNDETPNVGDVVTFTIEVTNAGPDVATNVAFKDIVPNGYSDITAISDGGTLSGEVITWSGFTINVNGSVEVTFQATVEASGEGVSYVNVSEVTASDQYDPDSTPDNDDGDQSEDDEDNAEVVPQQADLSLEKTVNDETPNVGDVVTFTIEVTNTGPNVATNVAFEDIVPNGYSDITAISDGGTLSGEVITWSGFTINVNGSVEVTFQATVEAPGEGVSYVNVSEVTASDQYDPDSTPDNDDGDQSEDDEDNAEVVPQQADLSLEKTVNDETPNVGDVVTFTIEVSNAGPDVATNVAFKDIVPNGYSDITAISDGGTLSGEVITWSGFTINVNGSVEVTFQATVEAPGEGVSYVNVSEVTASDQYDPDSTPDNDDGDQSEDDEDNAEIVPQQADLSLEKTVNDETPNVGDVVTFTIEVTNAGPDVATNVAFKDIVPNGYSDITAISDGGTLSGEVITWSGFTINVNGSVEVTFQATVEAPGEGVSYVNVSEVTASDQYDPDSTPDNDDGDQSEDDEDNAEVVPQQADLELTKTVDNETPNVGDVVTFMIDVENRGPNIATNVAIEDIVPNGYSMITSIDNGGSLSGNVITWSGLTIAVNNKISLSFIAKVEAPGDGVSYFNIAEVTASDQYDPDSTPDNDDGDQSEDDEDNAEVVPQQADLELTKTVNDETPNVGDVVTFSIKVENKGPDDATNVAVEDILPNGYGTISMVSNGGQIDGNVITWNNLNIPFNTFITLTFETVVNAPFDEVDYLNIAQVIASDQFDPDSTPDNDDGDQSEDDEDNQLVIPNGTICGVVKEDLDNDDIGDVGIEGVEVTLTDVDSGQTYTTTTDENGEYCFEGLEPGDYKVMFQDESEIDPDYVDVFDGDETPEDANDAVDELDDDMIAVTLEPGEDDLDNNAVEEQLGTICGNVSEDLDNDDVADIGIEGVEITLTDVDSGATYTTTTDENGDYCFEGLEPGDYVLTEQPENEIDEDYVDVFDGDETPEDANDAVDNLDDDTIPVTLEPGEDDLDNNFLEEQLGTICGVVKEDLDNDDIGDVGIEGVEVTLTDVDSGETYTTTTDENGEYCFEGLEPGDYKVMFQDESEIDPDYVDVFDGDETPEDANDAVDELDDDMIAVTLEPGEDDLDNNAVEEQLGTICGNVSEDLDNDDVADIGIEGVEITLTDVDSGATYTTTTDENGDYCFEGLEPGDYVLTEQPENEIDEDYVDVFDGDETPEDANDAVDNLDDDTIPVTLEPGEDDLDNNFLEEQLGTICGVVKEDLDNDDIGDVGIEGVEVTLTDVDSGQTYTTTTDENGEYCFEGLEPGDYKVMFQDESEIDPDYVDVFDGDETPEDANDAVDELDDDMIAVTLEPGEDDLDNNAVEEQLGTICGNVSEDLDNDDVADIGIEGVEITLTDVDSGATYTTTTDENGEYCFEGLEPGDYVLTEQPENEIDEDYVDVFDGDETPEDANDAVDNLDDDTIPVTLEPGEDDLDNNFLEEQLGTICGVVKEDLDNDDIGDVGIEGVEVTLTDVDSGQTYTTTTDENGEYCFEGLEPGDYKVMFQDESEIDPDYVDVFDGDETPEDANDAVDELDDDMIAVTLEPGEDDLDNNAVEEQLGSICGNVSEDLDNDDVADIGIEGVEITLTDVDSGATYTTTTDENGDYCFEGLEPGDYVLTEQPENEIDEDYVDVFDGDETPEDANDAVDNLDDDTIPVTVEPGEDDLDNNFLEELTGSLGDFVWFDENADGLQDASEAGINGITINLYQDNDMNGSYLFEATTVTADKDGEPGYYLFDDLPPGKYQVEFILNGTLKFSIAHATGFSGDEDDVNDDSDADPVTGLSHEIMLTSGEDDLRIDAGMYEPLSLGDFVWNDENNNGVFDEGEDPIPFVEVTLWKELNGDDIPDEVVPGNVDTDINGNYLFEELVPGRYIVQIGPDNFTVGALEGFATSNGNDPVPSPDDNVNNDDNGYDPDLAIDGIISKPVTLLSGLEPTDDGDTDPNTNLTVDFGFFEVASIGDYVWEDTDGDGVQDEGEEGINGVTVRLYNADTDELLQETTTIPNPDNDVLNGYYKFENLPSGNYYLEFVTPDGYINTYPNIGLDDADSDVDDTNGPGTTPDYFLDPGEDETTADAGFYIPALIGDYVWHDIGDEQYVQDPNDVGINGVTVSLYKRENGGLVLQESMVTTNNPDNGDPGWYEFDSLATGSYLVEFELPDGLSYVAPNQGGDDDIDSDVIDFVTGRTIEFPVNPGDELLNIDAGYEASTVPVELVDFSGRWNKTRNVNELSWVTATEINNDFFVVERSLNGSAFEEIGKVDGSGTTLDMVAYEFNDEDISVNGIYTYRLRQVDFDGSFEYIDAINIRVEREVVLNSRIYPNPASRFINIDIEVGQRSDLNVMLLDMQGRLVKADLVDLESITGREKVRINIDDIPGGPYIIRIVLDNKVINHKVLLIGN